MIRANCRARFTAADFDFIVRTLTRSRGDSVSLVDLLSDSETRDSILDHPRLVETILSNAGHLHISSQFYFYILARYVLQQAGIGDRKLCDYVGSLLETFSRANQLQTPDKIESRAHEYISDMLIALSRATPSQTFLLRAHVGNYSLFLAASSTKTPSGGVFGVRPTSSFTNKSVAPIISSSLRTKLHAAAN